MPLERLEIARQPDAATDHAHQVGLRHAAGHHTRDDADNPISWEPSLAFLKYAIVGLLTGSLAFLLLIWITAPDQTTRAIGPVVVSMVAAAAWCLLACGRPRIATHLLAIGAWTAVTGIAVFNGGVHTPIVVAYPLIIFMVGWLVSERAAIMMVGGTVVATSGFVVADSLGLLPAPHATPPAMHGAVQLIISVISGLMIVFLVRAYKSRLVELAQRTIEVKHREAELHRAQAVGNFGSWVYDIGNDTLRLSAETCRIFGLPVGTTGTYATYLGRTYAPDCDAVEAAWQSALGGKTVFDHEHRIVVGKTIRWVRQRAEIEFAADGRALRAEGIAHDITHRKQQDDAVRRSEQHFRAFFERSMVGMAESSPAKGWVEVNDRLCEIVGLTRDVLIRKTWAEITHPDDLAADVAEFNRVVAGEIEEYELDKRFIHSDGHVVFAHIAARCVRRDDGAIDYFVVLIDDISDRKRMEDSVRQLAFFDPLTRLPNRRLLNDRLSQAIAASKRSAFYGALLFLDLDNFKPLNDAHGHDAGDLLLVEVAERLKSCVREVDTVARFGGDEFVVMISELDADGDESALQAGGIAEKILGTLSEPYRLTVRREGQSDTPVEHCCTASIGVALFIHGGASHEDIMRRADKAMYQAKEAGRNRVRLFNAPA
jgi:diguanylate cyclase (GGDEF)-like protein/PAS domain S-box-containing protein